MTRAAILPGTQPQSHYRNTMIMEPQPLSKNANGGNIMDNKTLQKLMIYLILIDVLFDVLLYSISYRITGTTIIF